MSKIKILITYKDKHKLLNSNILTPIQTGRELAEESFDNMLGDNTGDNISVYNHKYAEFSAIYWAWKNYDKIGNPDYIGFMHYRRHFLFSNKNYETNFCGLARFPMLDDNYINNDLNAENIENILGDYELLIPKKINIQEKGVKNNYLHYAKTHNIKDYNKAISIINELYPEDMPIVKEYNESKYGYFLNMFVMKKEDFFSYCNWIFSILFQLEKQVNSQGYGNSQSRIIGFIGERLTAIYLTKLSQKRKTKELPVSFIDDTNEEIKNDDNNIIPIVLSSNNSFIPYVSVFLESIKAHTNKDKKYLIVILTTDIEKENQKIIKEQMAQENIKIVFYDVRNKLDKFNKDSLLRHISLDTYSRFFIPEILKNFDKCVYLDSDTICLDDIANLYNIELGDNLIGASVCSVLNNYYNTSCDMRNYLKTVLKIENDHSYFQAGVLIMNLKEMRKQNAIDKLLKITNEIQVRYADQCLLNILCKNKVKYIDMSWNYEFNHIYARESNLVQNMSPSIQKEYFKAMRNPKIIHYQGERKPWKYPEEEYATVWWKYARKSPYYEKIIYNNLKALAIQDMEIRIKTTKNSWFKKLFSKKVKREGFKKRIELTIFGIKISYKVNLNI